MSSSINKFSIGQKVYTYSLPSSVHLVTHFEVVAIVSNDDGLYYSPDKNTWIKEETIFADRMEAYKHIIHRCENEMNQPEQNG